MSVPDDPAAVAPSAPSPARSRASGRVTLADVARVAGVSPITASRALNGTRAVASGLAARVREAAERLGYLPDPAARALASRSSPHVAILIPTLGSAEFVELFESARQALRVAGLQTMIGITRHDPGEEEPVLRELLAHRPAGLLLSGLDRGTPTRTLIERSRVPWVHLMEIAGEPDVHRVGFSQADAAAAVARHLLGRGRRRIAFAAARLDACTMQRLDGWRAELERAGCYAQKLEWLNPAPSSLELGARLFEQIVGQTPVVDAIFFSDDDLAQGALLAAARLRIPIPGRLAVAGFGDLTGSDQMNPPLTTVRTPRGEIGARGAQVLLRLIRGEAVEPSCVDLGYALMVRKST